MSELERLQDIVRQTEQVRKLQKQYFKTPAGEAKQTLLKTSKQQEHILDTMLQAHSQIQQ